MKKYLENIDPMVLDYQEELKNIRRSLHKIPELAFEEFKTQRFIMDYLENLGYEPQEIAKTGVSLFIPGNIPGKAVALRSDIDALPVTEPEGCDFRSEHEGVMHACGHDGHMAMLLATAKAIKEHPELPRRDALLIFQPAEEGPGGAEPVTKTGVFEKYNVGEIYGYHLFPFVEEGIISTTGGPMMAMTSEFYPVIRGKSSHAGNPEGGIDAVVAASQFVVAVQSIVARNVAPNQSALINIGTFNAGEKMNIVAKEARLSGTLRSYSLEVQLLMKRRLEEVLEGIDKMFGTTSEINYVDMYPPVINDEELFEDLWHQVPEPKEPFEKVMLAEDFALYRKAVPGVFIGLGTGNEEHHSDLHTEGFGFDEDVLLRGLDLYLRILGKEA